MIRQVVWSPLAHADLLAIIDRIAPHDIKAAHRIVARIRRCAENLAEFPELGRRGRVKGTRELTIPHLPYVLAYEDHLDQVAILAVRHGKRRWPKTF